MARLHTTVCDHAGEQFIYPNTTLLTSNAQPDAHSPVNWPLAAFLAVVNIAIIACDLAEVNQWFHYTAFAALGVAAALRFVWLVVQYPKALNPQVRQEVLRTFATGTALILGAFAVSQHHLRT